MALPAEILLSFIRTDQVALAKRYLQEALRDGNDTESYLPVQILLQLEEGQCDEAFRLIQTRLAANPNDETALWYLPQCLNKIQRHQDALDAISVLLKPGLDDGDRAFLFALKASIHWHQLRTPMAELSSMVEEALRFDPQQSLALKLKYWIAHDRHDFDQQSSVIRSITMCDAGDEAAAILLARHIAETNPDDLKAVRALVVKFPKSQAVRHWAVECHVNRFFFGSLDQMQSLDKKNTGREYSRRTIDVNVSRCYYIWRVTPIFFVNLVYWGDCARISKILYRILDVLALWHVGFFRLRFHRIYRQAPAPIAGSIESLLS